MRPDLNVKIANRIGLLSYATYVRRNGRALFSLLTLHIPSSYPFTGNCLEMTATVPGTLSSAMTPEDEPQDFS